MAFLSSDLTQSWSASSEQVPMVPESQFLRDQRGVRKTPPAVVSEWYAFEIERNPGFPRNCYQGWTEIPVHKQATYLPFIFIEHLLCTVRLPIFVYLNPAVSLNLKESSFSTDFPSFPEEFKSSFYTRWKYYLSLLHSSYYSWVLHLYSSWINISLLHQL